MRRALAPIAASLAIGVLALAGCGSDDRVAEPPAIADLGPDPASVVPPRAPLYAEAIVRPEGAQAEHLESALAKLLDSNDPATEIIEALDRGLDDGAGFTYSETIEPWLGNRIGAYAFVTRDGELGGGVAIAVSDIDAAIEALSEAGDDEPAGKVRERTYRAVPYAVDENDVGFGFVEDFLMIASESALRAAIDAASDARSLADDDVFTAARETAEPGRLLTVYGDAATLVETGVGSDVLATSGAGPLIELIAGSGAEGKFVLSGGAVEAGLEFDLTRIGVDQGDPEEGSGDEAGVGFDRVPAEALVALAAPGRDLLGLLGSDAKREIERASGLGIDADVIPWIGDAALFVAAASPFELVAGLDIASTDAEASTAALEGVRAHLQRRSDTPIADIPGAETGFQYLVEGAPLPGATPFAGIAQIDDRILARVGQANAESLLDEGEGGPGDSLADAERFATATDALGEDLRPAMFIDFRRLSDLLDAFGGFGPGPDSENLGAALASLDYSIAGLRTGGEGNGARILLALREPEPQPSGDFVAAVIVP